MEITIKLPKCFERMSANLADEIAKVFRHSVCEMCFMEFDGRDQWFCGGCGDGSVCRRCYDEWKNENEDNYNEEYWCSVCSKIKPCDKCGKECEENEWFICGDCGTLFCIECDKKENPHASGKCNKCEKQFYSAKTDNRKI
jgi:hypothetical protein